MGNIRDWAEKAVMNFSRRLISLCRYPHVKVFILQLAVLLVCMGSPLASATQNDAGDGYTNDQCTECHPEMAEDHGNSTHREMQCLECHQQAAEEGHEESPPPPVDCGQCHAPHDEKVAHDAHTRLSCKACHQKDGVAAFDPESGQIVFSGKTLFGRDLSPHQMVARTGDPMCSSCHFQGNDLGAAALVLPPKSFLCMPCHVATFSIGDWTTVITFLIFVMGMGGLGAVWFSGSRGGWKGHGAQSSFLSLLRALVTEVLFINKLYRLSPVRWTIHALIYYPILMRLTFGLVALIFSLLLSDTDIARAMLDKNHPARALFFDFTGLLIVAGVVAALFRPEDDRRTVKDLPAPGRSMTLLLGLMSVMGFILEGLRIAMTGWPLGAQYAVIGYGISTLVKGMTGIANLYGYVWYGHAVIAGVFVAMIPFTRMIHILTAPVVLMFAARSQIQTNH
jgi:nitrate reductase gamma subunit